MKKPGRHTSHSTARRPENLPACATHAMSTVCAADRGPQRQRAPRTSQGKQAVRPVVLANRPGEQSMHAT
jgi:hypothetical protein